MNIERARRKLPIKLQKEPLLDAIFEMRFSSSVPASHVVPGVLYATLAKGQTLQVQRLPAAQLPEALRKGDPALRYAALVGMEWGKFNVQVGDESIVVNCKHPYPGWAEFKPAILEVVGELVKINILQRIDRYSLKYVDLLPYSDLESQVGALDWEVSIGGHRLQKEIASVRIEIPSSDFLHVVSIQSGAQVLLHGGGVRLEGIVVDVDTISRTDVPDVQALAIALPELLDVIHASNKRMFFDCLKPVTEQNLEPIYD